MPTKKTLGGMKRTKPEAVPEYRLKIDAYTPATIPMLRLAEYMHELAIVLGEPQAVHHHKLEAGSTVLVSRIEREALPKVRERTVALERGDAPREAQIAFKRMNKLLRDDNGFATLHERGKRGIVLKFPGRLEITDSYPTVNETGTIDGVVIRVGGIEKMIPIIMESEGEQIAHCYATKDVAKQLANRLFETVRLHGHGKWMRDGDGIWIMKYFRIQSFEALANRTLPEALARIRAVVGDWDSAAFDDLSTIRRGRVQNGGN